MFAPSDGYARHTYVSNCTAPARYSQNETVAGGYRLLGDLQKAIVDLL